MEERKNDLCRAAMKGQWSKVFKMLKEDRRLLTTKITVIGDTVLHMAMYAPQETKDVVADIVDLVCTKHADEESNERSNVLGAVNAKGNTPLHIAASIGNVEMCKMIGCANCSLIATCNKDGETPLFMAALYGNIKAFLWLHYLYMESPGVSSTDCAHCIRKNKDTILHCAIAEGHFDVAIEIVYLYKDLVKPMRLNDEGLSPLHLLAEKPSAFKSGALLGRPFGHIAYYLLPDMTKKKATTMEELMESERKSYIKLLTGFVVHKWIKNERKENTFVDNFFKSMIWVLDHFELAGQSINELIGVRKKKQKYTWSCQIMDQLLQHDSDSDGSPGTPSFLKPSTNKDGQKIETPLMIAAKNGVIEMVKMILEKFPSTVNIDLVNDEGRNIVLEAAEKKQTDVYKFLCKPEILTLTGSLFQQVDNDGNSALHLAAKYGGGRNWKYPGEVLLMQWEFKWLEYVRHSMPPGVFKRYNKKVETPDDIFKETHKGLTERDEEWLSKTSGACSLVSTLIATVAFATAATVPGGFDQTKGFPLLIHKSVYQFFVAMSLAALCFSLISTILLLSIVTARYHAVHFYIDMPFRLFLGMSSMFLSILCMWISFCAGHSFMLVQPSRKVYISIYIIISVPGTSFAISKFPAYWNLLSTSFSKVPAPSYNIFPARPKPLENNQKLHCADVWSKDVKICED